MFASATKSSAACTPASRIGSVSNLVNCVYLEIYVVERKCYAALVKFPDIKRTPKLTTSSALLVTAQCPRCYSYIFHYMQIDATQSEKMWSFFLVRNRARMGGVTDFTSQLKFEKDFIMDNQKSNNGNQGSQGNQGNMGREGAGSSMGKDLSNAAGNAIDKAKDTGKDLSKDASNAASNIASSVGNAASSAVDKAKDMAKDANASVQAGASTAHDKIDQAAEAAKPMVERLASTAHAGVDKLSGALSGATDGMDAKARQLTDAARTFADSGREYVRTSPATSVLVALGAGYLLSKILGSRR